MPAYATMAAWKVDTMRVASSALTIRFDTGMFPFDFLAVSSSTWHTQRTV